MQRLYLDVCALCRPFDNQNQLRIRLETDAVFLILRYIEAGLYRGIISSVHYKEISAIKDSSERFEMERLLSRLDTQPTYNLSQARIRAEALVSKGFGIADAAHIAFAE